MRGTCAFLYLFESAELRSLHVPMDPRSHGWVLKHESKQGVDTVMARSIGIRYVND